MSVIEHSIAAARAELDRIMVAEDLDSERQADESHEHFVVRRILEASGLAAAVSFTADELQCLICAMAGNFPPQFAPIRLDLLRKLAKASRVARGRTS